jgi:hypothetical protein
LGGVWVSAELQSGLHLSPLAGPFPAFPPSRFPAFPLPKRLNRILNGVSFDKTSEKIH